MCDFQNILYVPDADQLAAWWTGFDDDGSGIKTIELSLKLGQSCFDFNSDSMVLVKEDINIPSNAKNHTFLTLNLQVCNIFNDILQLKCIIIFCQ